MSLVLRTPRPLPTRGLLLATAMLASTLSLAPTLAPAIAHAASSATQKAVCSCAHCPGGAKCCCQAGVPRVQTDALCGRNP